MSDTSLPASAGGSERMTGKGRKQRQGVKSPPGVKSPLGSQSTTDSVRNSNKSEEDDFSEIKEGTILHEEGDEPVTMREGLDDDEDMEEEEESGGMKPLSAYENYEKMPPHVAPIPKIPRIPSVSSIQGSGTGGISAPNRPKIPQWVTASMIGKRVDEYGDVVDDDGRVLGRVAGDLPSMVGRTVLNQRGDILGDDGELLGYVAEVAKPKGKQAAEAHQQETPPPDASDENEGERPPSPTSIDEFLGGASGGLRVDHRGNILDSYGNIVGSFRDNLKNPRTPEEEAREERERQRRASQGGGGQKRTAGPGPMPNLPREHLRATGDAPNAASHRREGESPSDIFLDVKSTTEGIQLTIRIPTVFPGAGQGLQPRVNFS